MLALGSSAYTEVLGCQGEKGLVCRVCLVRAPGAGAGAPMWAMCINVRCGRWGTHVRVVRVWSSCVGAGRVRAPGEDAGTPVCGMCINIRCGHWGTHVGMAVLLEQIQWGRVY